MKIYTIGIASLHVDLNLVVAIPPIFQLPPDPGGNPGGLRFTIYMYGMPQPMSFDVGLENEEAVRSAHQDVVQAWKDYNDV